MKLLQPGLYTKKGHQTKLGEPTDVKSIEQMMSTKAMSAAMARSYSKENEQNRERFLAKSHGIEQLLFKGF